jgi:NADPH:quinone reductase
VTLNATGSDASQRVVPAMSTWPIPDGLDETAAGCVPVAFGTAEERLFRREPRGRADRADPCWAGGVGIAAIQLAKRAGVTVISTV